MSAGIQSFIADFLHRRKVADPHEFAAKAAASVERACGESGWDEQSIRKVLGGVQTDLFRRNPSVKKADLLDQLAAKVHSKVEPLMAPIDSSGEPCRILFFAANPSSTSRLQIDEEIRAIQNNLASAKYSANVSLDIALATRADDILQRLNECNPHVLHFSGHGSAIDGIALTDDTGGVQLLSVRAIDRLFCAMKGSIRLVVLNACFSKAQAQQISQHVDCVIGMTQSITDSAAAIFAASLYRALAFGKSVRNAFDQGIAAIALANLAEDDTPDLLSRKGVRPDSVVLVSPS